MGWVDRVNGANKRGRANRLTSDGDSHRRGEASLSAIFLGTKLSHVYRKYFPRRRHSVSKSNISKSRTWFPLATMFEWYSCKIPSPVAELGPVWNTWIFPYSCIFPVKMNSFLCNFCAIPMKFLRSKQAPSGLHGDDVAYLKPSLITKELFLC